MRNMKQDGKAVIIITHKLHEVMEVSDRVAVLRKGSSSGTWPPADTTPGAHRHDGGPGGDLNIDRPPRRTVEPRLEVKDLTVKDSDGVKVLEDVSFTAYGGEILGIAGISGCGQKELLEAIAGLQTLEPGSSICYSGATTGPRMSWWA